MACHQSHNIPWSCLSDSIAVDPSLMHVHFNLVKNCLKMETDTPSELSKFAETNWHNKYFPRRSGPDRDKAKKQVLHFAQKMTTTVLEFANTEMTKWTQAKERGEWPLTEQNFDRLTADALSKVPYNFVHYQGPRPPFPLKTWQTGQDVWPPVAADLLTILMHQGETNALLTLSVEGNCKDLHYYLSMGYDKWHYYGFRMAIGMAVRFYIHLNLLLADGTAISDPTKWHGQFIRDHCGRGYVDHRLVQFAIYQDMAGEWEKGIQGLTVEKAREICSIYFKFMYTMVAFQKFVGRQFDFQLELFDALREFEYRPFRDEEPFLGTWDENSWSHLIC